MKRWLMAVLPATVIRYTSACDRPERAHIPAMVRFSPSTTMACIPAQAFRRVRMVNPRKDVRGDGDLGIVEGVLRHGPAVGQVHQPENDPRGAEIHRQPRHDAGVPQ